MGIVQEGLFKNEVAKGIINYPSHRYSLISLDTDKNIAVIETEDTGMVKHLNIGDVYVIPFYKTEGNNWKVVSKKQTTLNKTRISFKAV